LVRSNGTRMNTDTHGSLLEKNTEPERQAYSSEAI
jgi:hypothetical protein